MTVMPSCTGVVQAGTRRPMPVPPPCTAGTRPRRVVPPLAERRDVLAAGARRLQDGLAFESRHQLAVDSNRDFLLAWSPQPSDVAPQAAARLVRGVLRRERRAPPRRFRFTRAAAANSARDAARLSLGSSGGSWPYSKPVKSCREPLRAHQPLVDFARRLLAVAHGVRDVGRAGDHIAARVELAAGWSRACSGPPSMVPLSLSVRPEARAKSRSTVSPTARTTVSHSSADTSPVGTGLRRPEAIVLAQPRLPNLDRLDVALRVADDAVRRGEEA